MYPAPIAWAAGFDPQLTNKAASQIGDEMRAFNNKEMRSGRPPADTHCFGPHVGIVRRASHEGAACAARPPCRPLAALQHWSAGARPQLARRAADQLPACLHATIVPRHFSLAVFLRPAPAAAQPAGCLPIPY